MKDSTKESRIKEVLMELYTAGCMSPGVFNTLMKRDSAVKSVSPCSGCPNKGRCGNAK